MSAREDFFTNHRAMMKLCQLPIFVDKLPNDPETLQSQILRRGVAVAAFSLLESYIELRLAELLNELANANISFYNFSDKFQELLVVDALNGLANRTNFLERQERQPYVVNHIKRVANFDDNPPIYTAFGFSPRGSNVSRDDVETVLKALEVESPWIKMNDITNDIGISRLSLKDDFRTFGRRRNRSAHESDFNIPYVDLLELLEGIVAIGIAFDVLTTGVFEVYLIAKSEKDRKARLKKLYFQYRFIDERSDGYWVEKSFPTMSSIKKYPSEAAAVAGVRVRKAQRYNIVRNISGIPMQLF